MSANCNICNIELMEDEEFHLEKLCNQCAEAIANNWWKWHSGNWLTWENPKTKMENFKANISQSLRWAIFKRDNYTCQHCSTSVALTIDHILAESKGGTLDEDNLQTLCRSCNSKKGVN